MDVNKKINIRLVETVEKYPCLYNNTIKEYSNRNCIEAAWVEVAEELSSTPDVVKDKWKVFRSIFVRRLRKMHMGELIKPYYLHEHMQFLRPYLRKSWDPECCNKILLEESESRVTPKNPKENKYSNSSCENSNTLDQEDINSVYLADMPQYSCNDYKRVRTSNANNHSFSYKYRINEFKISEVSSHQQDLEATDDEDYKRLFILSLLPDLEEMSNTQMRKFKIKVTTIINNIINNE
ncbi:uncharacterized protein LOC126760667 [Bactrocera neohumeralis]|uniref:uncharacterized protein LOC120775570 n=1 Tax=Bactrocera tryoni TaxID=59916 RepID=UPI001A9915FC|nr:uncharacterized protein LOC120775570 [Bactrocera tryoni]XP_050332442.1 uncharacterized protein LOC126760667 [Bactrocera neohumeralis]